VRRGVVLSGHRGVEAEYPENTLISFRAAAEQGYEMVELDLGVTKDRRIVVIHDDVINRVARNLDGSRLPDEPIHVDALTYRELRGYDFGIAHGERFKGEPIALFSDVLNLMREHHMGIEVDHKLFHFSPDLRAQVYSMVRSSGVPVHMSLATAEEITEIRDCLPDAQIICNGVTDEPTLARFSALAGKERFWVALPVDFERASWAPRSWFATAENAALVRRYAKLFIWAVKDRASFDAAVDAFAPVGCETSGEIKPEVNDLSPVNKEKAGTNGAVKPRVALFGDSIRRSGYGKRVGELLSDDFDVFQPDENGCYIKNLLLRIPAWRCDAGKCDIVHFNAGLWDIASNLGDGKPFSTVEEYCTNVVRAARLFQGFSKKVIFATTTPVENVFPEAANEQIAAYNAAVVPELQKIGVLIDDLNAVVLPNLGEYIRPDDHLHLTAAGAEACAAAVAASIRETAKTLSQQSQQ